MEPAAVRETNFMIGSADGNAENYKRFLEENPIMPTYPPNLKRLKEVTDRWDPRDHFVQIAHIDRGRFSDIIVGRQRSTGLVCALKVVKPSDVPWPSYRKNEAIF